MKNILAERGVVEARILGSSPINTFQFEPVAVELGTAARGAVRDPGRIQFALKFLF